MNYTESQLKAINEFGTNIIVSAGAGSGKTSVLSKRVLHHIENGIHINELLILTFTNKAAKEMKDRIRKNLSLYKDELDMLSNSYITTFDSFSLSILKKYHYLLNIKKDIGITDDSLINILRSKVIDEVFDIYYEKDDLVFNEIVLNNSLKNDKTIKASFLKVFDEIDKIGYDNYKNSIDLFYTDLYIKKLYNEYLSILEEKRNDIVNSLNDLSAYFDSSYIDDINASLSSFLNIDIKDIYTIKEVKLPNVKKGSDDEAKKAKTNFSDKIKAFLNISNQYGSYEDVKLNLLSNKDYVYKLLEISKLYIDTLNKEKEANNMYTFMDVAKLSIKILKENENVRKEISSSFKEIMVDEYQDTNDIEEELISLVSDNNVYMVGDIKQAIYGFRGSNCDLFKSKYLNYSNNNGGIAIDLLDNFRSRNEVVKTINNIFSLIMDNNIGGADYINDHQMIYGNKSYDNYIESDYNTKILTYENNTNDFKDYEIEIFTIANDIKNKISSKMKIYDKESKEYRCVEYRDFAIILDRSKYFIDYKKVFEYLSIPSLILKDEDISSSFLITLIKNAVDLVVRINNNDFDIDFKHDYFSIARSFLYEIDDNTLFNIYTNNSYKDTPLYEDFKINNIASLSVSDIIKTIVDNTKLYDKLYKIGDYNNNIKIINKIYDMSVDLNNKGYTINDFKDYIDNILDNKEKIKYNAKEDVNAVKIITIHGSKGLEYPICYFADLDHKFNKEELKDLYIVDNKYGINEKDSFARFLFKNNYSKEEISERLRLFYVALTRSKEDIIIVIPDVSNKIYYKDENGLIDYSFRNKTKSLADFIYYIKDYLPNYFSSIDTSLLNLSKNYLFKKNINSIDYADSNILVDEISIDKEVSSSSHFSKDEIKLIDKDTYSKMNIGTLVHEILEYLDFSNPIINIDNVFIKNKILKFLSNDILKNIKDATIYKEFEFVYEKDKEYHGVIDLMLVYNDHIDIIDYKLKNVVDDAYKAQLNGYKEYISNIKDVPINTYLYSILDEELIEIKY